MRDFFSDVGPGRAVCIYRRRCPFLKPPKQNTHLKITIANSISLSGNKINGNMQL